MPTHIHLLPIPPPSQTPNDPAPPLIHYTTGLKFDVFLGSGHIRPSTALVPAGDKPVTWFSTSEHWEPTATKCPIPGKL